MKAYLFQAALWCEDCAKRLMREMESEGSRPSHVDMADESSYDSDEWPKGPFPDGGGEADSPQHCDSCGVFLENPLTPDGVAYVKECAADLGDFESSWSDLADEAKAAGRGALRNGFLSIFKGGGSS